MNSTHLVLSAAALALAACADSGADRGADTSEPGATATTAMAEETTAMTPAAGSETPTDPQGFAAAAAASDMFEIEAGKLAQEKGRSAEVKEFGAMMVREHTKSSADLKAAAGEANVTVTPQMTAKQQSDLTALKGASGNFDSLYKTQQIAAHEMALALLRAQAEGGEAAPLKAFAAKTAPVVEKHLGHARDLP